VKMSNLLGYSDSEDESSEDTKKEVEKPPASAASLAAPKSLVDLRAGTIVAEPRRISNGTGLLSAGWLLPKRSKSAKDEEEEDVDPVTLDGEPLTAAELSEVGHRCGPAAWKWRVKEMRPAPRGHLLSMVATSASSRAKAADAADQAIRTALGEDEAGEEDPDMEDFAFLAAIPSTVQTPSAASDTVMDTLPALMPPPEADVSPKSANSDAGPDASGEGCGAAGKRQRDDDDDDGDDDRPRRAEKGRAAASQESDTEEEKSRRRSGGRSVSGSGSRSRSGSRGKDDRQSRRKEERRQTEKRTEEKRRKEEEVGGLGSRQGDGEKGFKRSS